MSPWNGSDANDQANLLYLCRRWNLCKEQNHGRPVRGQAVQPSRSPPLKPNPGHFAPVGSHPASISQVTPAIAALGNARCRSEQSKAQIDHRPGLKEQQKTISKPNSLVTGANQFAQLTPSRPLDKAILSEGNVQAFAPALRQRATRPPVLKPVNGSGLTASSRIHIIPQLDNGLNNVRPQGPQITDMLIAEPFELLFSSFMVTFPTADDQKDERSSNIQSPQRQ